jgi:hypothetical protein
MSELTKCNYCSYQQYKKEAKNENMKLTYLNNTVYVHPKEVSIKSLDSFEREKYFRAWFMELGSRCEC